MRNGYKAETYSARFDISRKILSKKENQEISPIRSEIGMMQEVSLNIPKVLKKDSGEYSCTSRSGEASKDYPCDKVRLRGPCRSWETS